MQHHRDNSGSPVWASWHAGRQDARETAMDVDEFSDGEVEQFDLDTARITGRENPDTYTTEPYGKGREPYDIREDIDD